MMFCSAAQSDQSQSSFSTDGGFPDIFADSSNARSFEGSMVFDSGSHEMNLLSSPIGELNWQMTSSSDDSAEDLCDSGSASDGDVVGSSTQNSHNQITTDFSLPADEPAVLFSGYPPFPVTDVNDLWLQVCGFSREEVVGQTMRIIQGPETERDLVDGLMAHVRRRQPFSTVLTNYTKTRQPFRNELRVEPVDARDGLRGTHFLARSRISLLTSPHRVGLDSDRLCGDWRFCLRCAQPCSRGRVACCHSGSHASNHRVLVGSAPPRLWGLSIE
jgi:hypothetical protein